MWILIYRFAKAKACVAFDVAGKSTPFLNLFGLVDILESVPFIDNAWRVIESIDNIMSSIVDPVQLAYRMGSLFIRTYWADADPVDLVRMYDLCRDKIRSLQRDVELLENHSIYLKNFRRQKSCAWVQLLYKVTPLIANEKTNGAPTQVTNNSSDTSPEIRPEYLIECEKQSCKLLDSFYDRRNVNSYSQSTSTYEQISDFSRSLLIPPHEKFYQKRWIGRYNTNDVYVHTLILARKGLQTSALVSYSSFC